MNNFLVKYIILLVAQILLSNYLSLTQFLWPVLLPAMILYLPIRIRTMTAMFIAFISGIAVDFFTTSMIGITSLALVPVALFRIPMIQLVFGIELRVRTEEISFHRQGIQKILLANALACGLFLTIYVFVESAGARALWIDTLKFLISLSAGLMLSTLASWILRGDEN